MGGIRGTTTSPSIPRRLDLGPLPNSRTLTPSRPPRSSTSSANGRAAWRRTRRLRMALVWFQGLILTWASETRNAFIRLLKNKGFKEDAGRTNRVVRHGSIHDPGIQQEPTCNHLRVRSP